MRKTEEQKRLIEAVKECLNWAERMHREYKTKFLNPNDPDQFTGLVYHKSKKYIRGICFVRHMLNLREHAQSVTYSKEWDEDYTRRILRHYRIDKLSTDKLIDWLIGKPVIC